MSVLDNYQRMGRWIVFIGWTAVAGCMSQPLVGNYVASDSACCSTVKEFDFRPIRLGEDVEFSLTSGGPASSFSGGREHFSAFKVPDGFVATSIQSKSYLSTDLLPMATAVIPELRFYDESFLEIGKAGATNAQGATGFWRSAISSRAAIPVGTRYIVVTAGNTSGGLPTMRSENGRVHRIPAAAIGDLSLRLFGESVR